MKDKVKNKSIQFNETVINCLKKMDSEKCKLLFVFEKEKFLGIITIGDIQRAIIKSIDLSSEIYTVLDKNKLYASEKEDINIIKNKMYSLRLECMPIINDKKELIDVIFWEDIFNNCITSITTEKINLPVVIMAGGEGTRLRPLTNLIPKPLIPINKKTIVENIMDNFIKYGCNEFIFSVNYMANTIKNYFTEIKDKSYTVDFIQEEKPLGTAGSLYLLKNKISSTFFVSNCDILVDVDLNNLLKYHKENKNTITVVSVIKNYKIPYGTIETADNGMLISLNEKPDVVYQINSGVYILEPEVFDYLPENTFMHITDLMIKLRENGKNVGVFPVSEGSWVDMGNWDEYLKLIKDNNNG